MIFSQENLKERVVFAPMDSGYYENACNTTLPKDPKSAEQTIQDWIMHHVLFPVNCSAWDLSIGNVNHMAHTVLQTIDMFSKSHSFVDFSSQVLCHETPSWYQSFTYMESNIMGSVRYADHPSSVKMVAGLFSDLFGSSLGLSLQAWCQHNRWPLLWALGDAKNADRVLPSPIWSKDPWPGKPFRIADPVVLNASGVNITVESARDAAFHALWEEVSAARLAAGTSGKISLSQWQAWWTRLEEVGSRVFPLRAFACDDLANCVGTTETGDCACKKSLVRTK